MSVVEGRRFSSLGAVIADLRAVWDLMQNRYSVCVMVGVVPDGILEIASIARLYLLRVLTWVGMVVGVDARY